MSTHDYFIAGRWRNRDEINRIAEAIRADGRTVYNFLENSYEGDGISVAGHNPDADPEAVMKEFESLTDWGTNPTFRKIFESDMQALKAAETFIVVMPAGLSAHMELGVAYGLGKSCYAIGQPEKPETLYLMLDGIFPDVATFLKEVKV